MHLHPQQQISESDPKPIAPGLRRRNDGRRAGRHGQRGIALAQLAIAVGLGAVLTAAVISTGLDVSEDVNLGTAREDNAKMVIAAVSLRTQTLGNAAASANFDVTDLRANGAPNIIRTANDATKVNQFNEPVTAGNVAGGVAGLYSYGFGDQNDDAAQDACDNVAAYLDQTSDKVDLVSTAPAALAGAARDTKGLTIDIFCQNDATGVRLIFPL